MTDTPVRLSVNVICRDLALCDFYRDLLSLNERLDVRSAVYRSLSMGQSDLGFHSADVAAILDVEELWPHPPALVHYPNFDFDSEFAVERLGGKVIELGGLIRKGPYRTIYGAWQTICEDPEGTCSA